MAWGGWLHFGPVALSGSQILKYAAIWGATFLLVGCFEEGSLRCYLQSTLTRGINFWWAAGPIALMCGSLLYRGKGNGAWGVYIIALLGLVPLPVASFETSSQRRLLAGCLGHLNALRLRATPATTAKTGSASLPPRSSASSFASACGSPARPGGPSAAMPHGTGPKPTSTARPTAAMWLTGHLLSTTTAGNPLWSGGTDGPEGSLLIIPIVLLLLAWLLVIYRQPRPSQFSAPAVTEQLAS